MIDLPGAYPSSQNPQGIPFSTFHLFVPVIFFFTNVCYEIFRPGLIDLAIFCIANAAVYKQLRISHYPSCSVSRALAMWETYQVIAADNGVWTTLHWSHKRYKTDA